MMTWRLKEFLDSHNLTPYALVKESGLAANTVYAMSRGEQKQAALGTLDKTIAALKTLTGEPVSVCDLLEHR